MLWHFHQPDYRNPHTGEYELPWVRLHALKDYSDMAAHMEEFPEVRATFNFVPSLVRQLEDYASGKARDPFLELSARPADGLDPDELEFVLSNFFRANLSTMVEPYPRYRELLEKRDLSVRFRTQEVRDLQVWFNLAWCGRSLAEGNEVVRELMFKGRGFSEEDKFELLSAQGEVIRGILPRYRKLEEEGRVELSTSPFYHPILPLLCHPEDAKLSRPDLPLPSGHMDLPEDAAVQLRRAREEHERAFGRPPEGLWPPEGAVSERALEVIGEAGFSWAASDGDVLALSLGGRLTREELLRPYRFGPLTLFFREHELSDRIGFSYSGWPAGKAVGDLLGGVEKLTSGIAGRPIASVALDGENPWEFYPGNGSEFLKELYGALSGHPTLHTVTFSDYMKENPPKAKLSRIHPGSWVSPDFHIWMGQVEDNTAWDLLYAARRSLRMAEASLREEGRQKAWENIYVAEGSDWFWWYGDEHWTEDAPLLDQLFRERLRAVYEHIDQPPPDVLSVPIKRPPPPVHREPTSLITPELDGRITHFFEWLGAGAVESPGPVGTMRRVGSVLERILYGFDRRNLYLGITFRRKVEGYGLSLLFEHVSGNYGISIGELREGRGRVPVERFEGKLRWRCGEATFAVDRMAELAVPLKALGLNPGSSFEFSLQVLRRGEISERWPAQGYLVLFVPDEGWELRNWKV